MEAVICTYGRYKYSLPSNVHTYPDINAVFVLNSADITVQLVNLYQTLASDDRIV